MREGWEGVKGDKQEQGENYSIYDFFIRVGNGGGGGGRSQDK